MKNKKLLSLVIAGVLGGSLSVVSVNAAGKTDATQVPAKLTQKAEKLGVDISGLSREDAKAKVKEVSTSNILEKAKQKGIDTTGLSKEDIKAKIKELKAEKSK